MFSKYQIISNLAISKIILGSLNIIYSVHSSLNVGFVMILFSQYDMSFNLCIVIYFNILAEKCSVLKITKS